MTARSLGGNTPMEEAAEQLPSVTPGAAKVEEARTRWHLWREHPEQRSVLESDVRRRLARKWEFIWAQDELLLNAKVPFANGMAGSKHPPASHCPALRLNCEGTRLEARKSPVADSIDELAYIMAEISQSLGWGRGDATGSAEFVRAYRRHSSLYENDFYTWAIDTACKIREHRFDELEPEDWEFVAEEIDDLGKSQRDALRSQMVRLLAHLLKWQFAPRAGHENSWRASIESARMEIGEIIEKNPGLKSSIDDESFSTGYRKAIWLAVEETNLARRTFPAELPWTFEQVMTADFLPD
jgi:hypothetical protein